MSAINLNQLLHNINNGIPTTIRIPKIQRDYAEGRETEFVEKKRYNLLSDMLDVVFGIENTLSLDFVYGIKKKSVFEPLDGQQRLTTLFLLHWLFGRNNDIKDVNNHSLFVYETRKTSEDFCHWLVNQSSDSIIGGWVSENSKAKTINITNEAKWNTEKNANGIIDKIANRLAYPLVRVPNLLDFFMANDDFKWDWHNDPNIHSMIVVLETAYKITVEKGFDLQDGIKNKGNLDNISFELLDKLSCDGDELFEKMNARGKALTTFDLLKSSLEDEMEAQGYSKASDWRNKMDNAWINYCWDNSNIPVNPSLEDVKKVETKLERLLIRLIGKTFFTKQILYSNPTSPGQNIESCIFKECDKIADSYFKYARFERRHGSSPSFTTLSFDEVMCDIDNMLYIESNTSGKVFRDIAYYLQNNGLKMHPDNNNTLLDDFTADNLNHDIRVIFYAMLAYLKRVNACLLVSNSIEFANFKDWMRFVRNTFLLANKNARIDKPDLVKKAIEAVDKWLEEYFTNYHKGISNNEMLNCIADYIVKNTFGQEQERLDEEALKAKLRIGGIIAASKTPQDWEKSILYAEKNPYMWGQIIAPLSWSFVNGQFDLNIFDNYMLKLNELFSQTSLSNRLNTSMLLIQAALSISDYRFNGNATWGSLGNLTDDRDVSWKRHLREKNNCGVYGNLIKMLLDKWLTDLKYTTASTYDDFLSSLIKNNPQADWRYFIQNLTTDELKNLFNIPPTTYRYINNDNGHIFVYRSKSLRSYSIRYELLTSYLYVNSSIWKNPWKAKFIDHYLGNSGPFVEFENTNTQAKIKISLNTKTNSYEIDNNGTVLPNCDVPTVEKELKSNGVII